MPVKGLRVDYWPIIHTMFIFVVDALIKENHMEACLPTLTKDFIVHYYNTEQFDKAEKLLVHFLKTKHAGSQEYLILDLIDRKKGDQRPERDPELQIETAVKR